MLEILAIIAANVLSLPGILGLGLGMLTRNPIVGSALGGLVGVGATLVFAGFDLAAFSALEMGLAVLVGVVAGGIGTGIRRIGATV